MNVAIRADASSEIGTGHVMRCLTLAKELMRFGARTVFISRDLPGNINYLIAANGFEVVTFQGTGTTSDDAGMSGEALDRISLRHGEISWLVVDSYALDAQWENALRGRAGKILVVDDLADRAHDCDALLDQNQPDVSRYGMLVPKGCRLMLGPAYALIRDEFRAARSVLGERDGRLCRILVFFGGADSTGETGKTLEALGMLDFSVTADVVVGSSNPRKEQVKRMCEAVPGLMYHCQVDNMAYLMARADLSIGAGGTTTWERCSVGLPSVVITVAPNQDTVVEAVRKAGACEYLGPSGDVTPEDIKRAVTRLSSSPERLMEMSRNALRLVDGDGAERVASTLIGDA
jgi:UDP-2,4-diacetamido-2,4,6-trideoxy-beta-L-altropyranose hydrolase